MAKSNQLTCPECNSHSVYPGMVEGLLACQNCGKVFPAPADYVAPVIPDKESSPEEHELIESLGEFKVPDLTEVVYGWRAWGVRKDTAPGETPKLWSVTHREAFWTPRAPMQATCGLGKGRANGANPRGGHEVPDEGCSCGLYSAKTYEHLMGMSYHHYDAERNQLFHIVGKVKLWGKVIEGSQGWRSEVGYPETLYVPFEAWYLAESLAESYGVDVQLKNILAGVKDVNPW